MWTEERRGVLTCRTTPAVALLWLSHRAGQGGAGSSGREDRLSRTVPVTRVLHRSHSHHSSNSHCQFHIWLHVQLQNSPTTLHLPVAVKRQHSPAQKLRVLAPPGAPQTEGQHALIGQLIDWNRKHHPGVESTPLHTHQPVSDTLNTPKECRLTSGYTGSCLRNIKLC